MADPFSRASNNVDSPAKKAFAITPANDTELATATKGLYIGGDGNINVVMSGDTANTLFTGVVAGSILPFRIKVVHAAGTTATGIVGLA